MRERERSTLKDNFQSECRIRATKPFESVPEKQSLSYCKLIKTLILYVSVC